MPQVVNGTVYKPEKPVLRLSNGQLDSTKHPFIVVAQDQEAIYGFHMTSTLPYNNALDEVLYQELRTGEHIQYNNHLITQSAFVKLDHIHRVTFEEIYANCNYYAFIKPKTNDILLTLVSRHVLIHDYSLAIPDTYTQTLVNLTYGNMSDSRFNQLYRDAQKIITNPAYRELFEEYKVELQKSEMLLKRSELLKAQLEMNNNTEYNYEYEIDEPSHHRRAA